MLGSLICAAILAVMNEAPSFSLYVTYGGPYIMLVLMQIFIYAWAANEISVQSIAIADAIFESEWDLFDIKSKKLLVILLARVQKPLEMRIGPFNPMTNETALLMVKAIGSYVSVFQGSYDE
ncbi:odorant receptor Or2-like [Sitophilus oryzae]|uniref:Odorant receptor Or2-like n=1 Tax=Sitophilus oryzae TaxID=7048 RepID=A0A6J2Y3G6_SITOR|nr:odorant receptor Or2-like [Sitophilus oryzae]